MILPTSKLSFGINLSLTLSDPHSNLIAEAHHAETLGLDVITVHPDHPGVSAQFGPDACLETWTALSWIAAQTTTIHMARRWLLLNGGLVVTGCQQCRKQQNDYKHPPILGK